MDGDIEAKPHSEIDPLDSGQAVDLLDSGQAFEIDKPLETGSLVCLVTV